MKSNYKYIAEEILNEVESGKYNDLLDDNKIEIGGVEIKSRKHIIVFPTGTQVIKIEIFHEGEVLEYELDLDGDEPDGGSSPKVKSRLEESAEIHNQKYSQRVARRSKLSKT